MGMYRLTICVTPEDRMTLGRMAARYDGTISGVVRQLVRDAVLARPLLRVPEPVSSENVQITTTDPEPVPRWLARHREAAKKEKIR
jgi:hypothetical protein